jgi:RsiW-degrading membrane proteinase PrsW (M82 family)
MLKDNAVSHHFQHICAVFFGSMIVSVYLGYTLEAMSSQGWIDKDIISGFFGVCGFSSAIVWFLWFLRTKENNAFDTTYRILVLTSGVVAAILGRAYVGV